MARERHTCHARNCEVAVPREMLMCRKHWFMVPRALRAAVLQNYRRGQCDDWSMVSSSYIAAQKAAVNAVAIKESHGA